MYNPKEILTDDGYEKLIAHHYNIKAALSFISNHADDLHIGAKSKDNAMDTLIEMQNLINSRHLLTGDGEKDE